MRLLLGMVLLLSTAAFAFAQDEKRNNNREQKSKTGENKDMEAFITSKEKNVEVMLKIFSAIERRDLQRALELFHPDVEFYWPPSLPYGGTSRGLKINHPTWIETWDPLQPTETERRMDPRVVAASAEEVVVLWRQRGVSPAGERIDTPVLGLYQLREGKLARAQMFYFDSAAALDFLAKVKGR
ncbi:MAG TPA: nuclear transport factor 2 family protein [Candidatus Angelobacter sp.]|nr:nuclear transport factor 2 family protein [Candidatus Angelobacter sp.]